MVTVEMLLERAKRAVRRMSKDPELESVAHEATLRAMLTYDVSRNDSLEAWVVFVVKVDAKGYLRKRDSRREEAMAAEPPIPKEQSHELCVSREDWELLCEKYIERWNYTAIARKRGCSVNAAKEAVAAAVRRFERANSVLDEC